MVDRVQTSEINKQTNSAEYKWCSAKSLLSLFYLKWRRAVFIQSSEFSGAWGKRGEGGQGREGVQLPDSLMDEAVLQSVGPGLETPLSPPWW